MLFFSIISWYYGFLLFWLVKCSYEQTSSAITSSNLEWRYLNNNVQPKYVSYFVFIFRFKMMDVPVYLKLVLSGGICCHFYRKILDLWHYESCFFGDNIRLCLKTKNEFVNDKLPLINKNIASKNHFDPLLCLDLKLIQSYMT